MVVLLDIVIGIVLVVVLLGVDFLLQQLVVLVIFVVEGDVVVLGQVQQWVEGQVGDLFDQGVWCFVVYCQGYVGDLVVGVVWVVDGEVGGVVDFQQLVGCVVVVGYVVEQGLLVEVDVVYLFDQVVVFVVVVYQVVVGIFDGVQVVDVFVVVGGEVVVVLYVEVWVVW